MSNQTATSSDQPLIVSHHNEVALVTLNRPTAYNALNQALTDGLVDAFNQLADSSTVRAVVLTGEGSAFCAGVDLKELTENPGLLTSGGLGPESPLVKAMNRCQKPIVGAVNGPAVTGGFELALACDFLYASDRARFADTHARVGILPGWGLSQKLPRLIGINRAREMSLSGNFVSAGQALEWGLVNRVFSADELVPAALDIAHQMSDADPEAVPALKQLMNDGWELPLGEALTLEGERANAFAQKVDFSRMDERLEELKKRAARRSGAS